MLIAMPMLDDRAWDVHGDANSRRHGTRHDLKFTTAGDHVSFTVPAIGVYAVAAIELTPHP